MPRRHLAAPFSRTGLALSLSLAVAMPLSFAAEPAAAERAAPISYAIPAGPLGAALNRFAAETGIFLAGDASLTAGKRSTGLRGSFGVDEALRRLLSGTGVEAVRQADGRYTLRAVPAGSAVVLPAMKVSADAVAGGAASPAYAGGQVARGGRLGVLGDSDIMDTPFSLTSYTSQTIENQQARSVVDVLANESALRSASARTNINEDFTLRGFPVASQDVALNGMYGLMPYFRVPIEMAERVEVLRGPNALLNGMAPSGSIGGAINIVPKRASVEPLTRVTAEYVSESIVGAHVDAGRRFGDGDAFGARFNGMLRGGDSTVDHQDTGDQLAVLALDYRGERLRASLDALHQQQEIDGVVRQFTLGAVTRLPDAPDGDLSYPGAWGDLEMEDSSVVARVEYDLAEAITVYAGAGERSSSMDALTGNPMLMDNDGNYLYAPAWQLFDIDSRSYEMGLNAAFVTGPVSHQFAVGATRVEQDTEIFFYTSFAPRAGSIHASVGDIDVSTAGIDVDKNRMSETTLTSYAIADTLGFLDDRVKLTLGVRQQRVEVQNYDFTTGAPSGAPYDERELTPVAGVVVKPWQNVSLYASYVEGLSQGPTAPIDPTLTNSGEVFEPTVTEQIEIGAKADWGQWGGTVALYELSQPTGVRVGNTFRLSGEQRHRGIELNLFGEPVESVRVLGGLSWIDSELTGTQGGVDDGNDAIGVPELQINLGGEWDTPFLSGFTLTARVIRTGEQYIDTANTLEADAWTRVDIGARYRTNAFGKPLVLRANVENLFDEAYWGVSTFGYLHVGEARTLLLSATVDF